MIIMTSKQGTWAKLSSTLWLNGKWRRFSEADPAAAVLWINAISYCANQLTDGTVPSFVAHGVLGGSDAEIRNLAQAHLVEPTDDGGFKIHDYLDYQRSREDVESTKRKRQKAANIRWHGKETDSEENNVSSLQ